ncbi:MAG TPA: hypothetical protein VG147_05025 [Solirubrobacteraceae bacterium]|jgi:beta-phosphoglucomutase-like phosphatase (HAD superfamily)|nr:hypothetical protein [Solirubrobacteraceae bacterium]
MHELVIFDCDGVLVDSEVISNEVLARMLTREGVPTTLAEARRACQGLLLTDVRDRAQAKLGRPFPRSSVISETRRPVWTAKSRMVWSRLPAQVVRSGAASRAWVSGSVR